VVRVKADIMRSSSVGFLAANRLEGGRSRGTAGVDASLNFSDKLHFTGQLALSYGDKVEEDLAFFLRPSFDSATSHFHIRYSQLGRRFGDNANAVGFVPDDNRRELDSALTKTFWLRKGPIERIGYESNYNVYWGFDRPAELADRSGAQVRPQEQVQPGPRPHQEQSCAKGFRNDETEFS
jgi:hypothetical protein